MRSLQGQELHKSTGESSAGAGRRMHLMSCVQRIYDARPAGLRIYLWQTCQRRSTQGQELHAVCGVCRWIINPLDQADGCIWCHVWKELWCKAGWPSLLLTVNTSLVTPATHVSALQEEVRRFDSNRHIWLVMRFCNSGNASACCPSTKAILWKMLTKYPLQPNTSVCTGNL